MRKPRPVSRLASVAVALVIAACAVDPATTSATFRVEQGVITSRVSAAGKLEGWSLERTTSISMKALVGQSGGERKAMGYVIYAPPGVESFEAYSVSLLPGVPEKIGGTIAKNSSRDSATTSGLRTSPRAFYKVGYEEFLLNEGDPVGEYRIDVFADGKLVDRLTFEVKAE